MRRAAAAGLTGLAVLLGGCSLSSKGTTDDVVTLVVTGAPPAPRMTIDPRRLALSPVPVPAGSRALVHIGRQTGRRTGFATVNLPAVFVIRWACAGTGRIFVDIPPVTGVGSDCDGTERQQVVHTAPTRGQVSVDAPEEVTWSLVVETPR